MGRAISRNPWLTIAFILTLIALPASQLPSLQFDTATESFLHADDPILLEYNEFRDQYGRDEIIVIALRPKKIFDLGFLELVREIHREIEDNVPHLDEVTSLVNARATRGSEGELLVEDLMEEWPETPEQLQAIEDYARQNPSFRNLLLSEDATVTTIAIKTSQYSATSENLDFAEGFESSTPGDDDASAEQAFLTDAENSEVINSVEEIVDRYRDRDVEIWVAGSPVVTHAVKRSMQRDMFLFMRLTLVSIAVLLFALFRRKSAVVIPLVVVVLSLLATIGLMAATGTAFKLPTTIMPSFLLAVGIGDSVHILTLFYRAFDRGASKEDAIADALEHSGMPVTLTSLTTAGGLMSFAPAALAPISDLGFFAPLGVMTAWLLSLVMLPALLAALPVGRRHSSVSSDATDQPEDALDRVLARAASISADRPWAIVTTSAAIMVIAAMLALQVRFSHNPLDWLPESSEAKQATVLIDEEMRGSITLEVILSRESENAWHEPDTLKRLESFSDQTLSYESGEVFIGNAFSVVNVLKEINRALNENRVDYYTIPEPRALVAQEFLLFENSGSDDLEDLVDSQWRNVRLTLKAPFVDSVDYASTLSEIQTMAESTMGPDTQVSLTGIMPLLFRTMTAVNITMVRSYIIAFSVIAILMILMIGSVKLGLVAMIPNLLPILLALGVMGMFGMPLDTFTLMIASISLGLAVDDTIHFMHNYRRYLEIHGDSRLAIRDTLATTGRALLFTTLVLATSFAVFTFSEMTNIFNFGLLTSFAIATALLADILLAPALMHLIHRNEEA